MPLLSLGRAVAAPFTEQFGEVVGGAVVAAVHGELDSDVDRAEVEMASVVERWEAALGHRDQPVPESLNRLAAVSRTSSAGSSAPATTPIESFRPRWRLHPSGRTRPLWTGRRPQTFCGTTRCQEGGAGGSPLEGGGKDRLPELLIDGHRALDSDGDDVVLERPD